jgi:hypothetical protein
LQEMKPRPQKYPNSVPATEGSSRSAMIIRPSYCLALAGLVSTVAASPGNTDLEVDKRLTCHQGLLDLP